MIEQSQKQKEASFNSKYPWIKHPKLKTPSPLWRLLEMIKNALLTKLRF
jgi:hypothetical protein